MYYSTIKTVLAHNRYYKRTESIDSEEEVKMMRMKCGILMM